MRIVVVSIFIGLLATTFSGTAIAGKYNDWEDWLSSGNALLPPPGDTSPFRSVIAFGPNGVRIVFDQARKPSDGPMHFYLTRVWAQNLNLGEVETIRINGLEAATGVSRINTNKGQRDVRLVAIRMRPFSRDSGTS